MWYCINRCPRDLQLHYNACVSEFSSVHNDCVTGMNSLLPVLLCSRDVAATALLPLACQSQHAVHATGTQLHSICRKMCNLIYHKVDAVWICSTASLVKDMVIL